MVRLAAGLELGRVYANVGGVTISEPIHSLCYVLIHLFFSGLFYSRDLHKNNGVWGSLYVISMYITLIIQLCQGKHSFPFYGTFNGI